MPTVDVYNLDKQKVGTVDLDDAVFGGPVNESLLYEAVKNFMANRRGGNAKTKKRGEVRGGGKKPWKQKGTGRARQGSTRSPNWTGGGIVFGPQPRSYAYELPKKVRRGALRSVLALRLQEEKLLVLDSFDLAEPKTKRAVEILRTKLGVEKALIVDAVRNANLEKSVRNIPGFSVAVSNGINVYDILRHPTLIVTREAIAQIQGKLAS